MYEVEKHYVLWCASSRSHVGCCIHFKLTIAEMAFGMWVVREEVSNEHDHGKKSVEKGEDLVHGWMDAQAATGSVNSWRVGMNDGLGMYWVLPCLQLTSLRREATDQRYADSKTVHVTVKPRPQSQIVSLMLLWKAIATFTISRLNVTLIQGPIFIFIIVVILWYSQRLLLCSRMTHQWTLVIP